jgi:isoleucyl-tRNA synthetase
VLGSGDGIVTLDTDVTPELEAEGLARDLVRQIQQARRDAGLAVSDRIALTLGLPPRIEAAARDHQALIAGETLATSVTYAAHAGGGGDGTASAELDGEPVRISVARA